MAKKQNRKGRGKKVYSIVVDGKTEAWYLQMLKRHENLKSIKIKPDLPKKSKFIDLYSYVKEQARYFDKVIWTQLLLKLNKIIS